MAASEEKFYFHPLKERFNCLEESKEFLEKWNLVTPKDKPTRRLEGCFQVVSFSFNKHFQSYQKRTFCEDFLRDCNVHSALQINQLEVANSGEYSTISVQDVPCTLIDMAIFDKLYDEGIVRESGSIICKCFHEDYEDIPVDDELRKLLLLEDSDNYGLYDEKDRSELLFQLFTHLCIGGPICQYEDSVKPYLEVTRGLYKELISIDCIPVWGKTKGGAVCLYPVDTQPGGWQALYRHLFSQKGVVKDPNTLEISVVSHVFKISVMIGDKVVFPGSAEHFQKTFVLLLSMQTRKL